MPVPLSVQLFSRYPVLNIQPTTARQTIAEPERHGQTYFDAHVGRPVEAPAKAADQIDHRIEQATVRQAGGSMSME